MTRQNIIPSDVKVEDNKSQAVLIPFWDMANHINGILTTGYNDELEMVESQAMMDFKKGEQIFIYYGNRNNTDLLIHNGFVYPENDNKNITIHLSLSSSDELFEDRSKLLGKLNIQKSGDFSLYLSNQDPTAPVVSSDLLGFVRVFNMSKGNYILINSNNFILSHLQTFKFFLQNKFPVGWKMIVLMI